MPLTQQARSSNFLMEDLTSITEIESFSMAEFWRNLLVMCSFHLVVWLSQWNCRVLLLYSCQFNT